MNVKVLLTGHGKSDAISFRNAEVTVNDDGVLVATSESDSNQELGRFELFQAYWKE